MLALPKIDTKATINKTRQFFLDDWERAKLLAGFTYSTPRLKFEPVYHDNRNTAVDRMDKKAMASELVTFVLNAIEQLPDLHAKVLKFKYINGLRWDDIEERTGYTSRRCQQVNNEALVEFADLTDDVLGLCVYGGNDESRQVKTVAK